VISLTSTQGRFSIGNSDPYYAPMQPTTNREAAADSKSRNLEVLAPTPIFFRRFFGFGYECSEPITMTFKKIGSLLLRFLPRFRLRLYF